MTAHPLRVALLTPEFATEASTGGGLGVYVYRTAKALRELGHYPEVFVASDGAPAVTDLGGVRVEFVTTRRNAALGALYRASRFSRFTSLENTVVNLKLALALGRALRLREDVVAFDLVQSSDFGLAGLFVRRRAGRPHLVRCSWSRALFAGLDGVSRPLDHAVVSRLELRSVRQADVAYCPSRFLARLMAERHGLRVATVRPPFILEVRPVPPSFPLPERFLLHFGQIGFRKGSDVIADALVLAWREEPGISMLWAGREIVADTVTRFARSWGDHANQVRWLGPVARPELYGILDRSLASGLPSRLDNFPNAAIESLLLGVPVIGSDGASIDEIVTREVNGLLVPVGDAPALARALVQVWREQVPWPRGAVPASPVMAEMEPHRAVCALLRLAGREA